MHGTDDASDDGAICGACGYDLKGSHAQECPECGMPRRSWRSACAAPWLVVPALRLLVWGPPVLVVSICVGRMVAIIRNLGPQFEPIMTPEALLLYATPLLGCIVGA